VRTSVARGALLGVAGQVWHLATAFILYMFLARQLGPEQFGQWRVVLSVLAWFEIALHAGVSNVITKNMAERPDEVRIWGKAAYLGQAIVIVTAFVAMIVLAGPIANLLSDPTLASYLRISALDIPAYGLFVAASSILLGRHRFERQVTAMAVYATAKMVAIGALVATGFSVKGALVGNALASIVGLAVAFLPQRGERVTFRAVTPLLRGVLLASVPFTTLSLIEGVGQSADLWLVSAVVVSATAVGWYAAATVLADIPVFLFDGISRVMFPSVARALAEKDSAMSSRYTLQAVRLGIIVSVLGVGVIAGAGRSVLVFLYSSAYVGAFVPLAVLMVAAVGRVLREACTNVLMIRNQRSRAITILVVSVIAEIGLLAVLAGRFGVVGAAAAASAAALLGGVWSAVSVRDLIGARPVLTFVRCAVAGIVVAFALSQLVLAPIWVVVTVPLASLAYVAIIALIGEIDRDDVASVRAALGR
jgi:O-antigen/teichoic acid export membrane protein